MEFVVIFGHGFVSGWGDFFFFSSFSFSSEAFKPEMVVENEIAHVPNESPYQGAAIHTPAHPARALKRQTLSELRVSEGQIFVLLICQEN